MHQLKHDKFLYSAAAHSPFMASLTSKRSHTLTSKVSLTSKKLLFGASCCHTRSEKSILKSWMFTWLCGSKHTSDRLTYLPMFFPTHIHDHLISVYARALATQHWDELNLYLLIYKMLKGALSIHITPGHKEHESSLRLLQDRKAPLDLKTNRDKNQPPAVSGCITEKMLGRLFPNIKLLRVCPSWYFILQLPTCSLFIS